MVWETREVREEGAVIGSPTFINFHSVYILTRLDTRCLLTHPVRATTSSLARKSKPDVNFRDLHHLR